MLASIYLINLDAKPIGIDQNVIDIAIKTIERLNAERNLRY
jgi:hypothetical protein